MGREAVSCSLFFADDSSSDGERCGPAEVAKIKVPLLAINGKADTTVVPETAQKIVDAAVKSPDAEVLLLDGADHTFCVFSGDDTVLKTLVQDTIDWFKKTL